MKSEITKNDILVFANPQYISIAFNSQWNFGRNKHLWPRSSISCWRRGFSFKKSDCRDPCIWYQKRVWIGVDGAVLQAWVNEVRVETWCRTARGNSVRTNARRRRKTRVALSQRLDSDVKMPARRGAEGPAQHREIGYGSVTTSACNLGALLTWLWLAFIENG